jgi:hypothetical protein
MGFQRAPYPPSETIVGLSWDDEVLRFGGERAGDNWPITWGDDGLLYTAYGDGNGFGPRDTNYTLAFATLSGTPPDVRASDLPMSIDPEVGWGKDGIKASGLLMVGGILYLFVRNYKVAGNWRHSRLAWSGDHGRTWTWADWHFLTTFGCPEFVQFGPNYAGARDDYVYVVSQDGDSAYDFDPDIVLARVPRDHVAERAAYTFFAGMDERGGPRWDREIARRQPIFTDPRGTQRIGMTYNRALDRYFLTSAHRVSQDEASAPGDGRGAPHTPALGVFDAPEPWGPWTTVYDSDTWADGWMIHHKFPTAWMGDDGRTMWLAFSGEYHPGGADYCLLTRRAVLSLAT